MKTYVHLWWYLPEFFLEWQIVQMKIVEKTKHTFYIQYFFVFSVNHAMYEILWKNMVDSDRPQMTI